ncbi:phage terminase large subunit [Paenibacillus sp. GYB004]|uniref:phage terminase large subunit n=1 Tax=Paenibacillus sp. GYB004 TaxID=2994393 RepID=UPI002F967AEA
MATIELTRVAKEKKLALKREARIRKARHSLWEFCKTESPTFYRDSRWHLKLNCWILQALYERKLTKLAFVAAVEEIAPAWFLESEEYQDMVGGLREGITYKRLMQNIPPRFGKSRTLVNFCKWAFGQDQSNRVITCSYNDDQASDFSRYTRDGIDQTKTFPHEIIFNDIFPGVYIKDGNGSYHQWALDGQFFNYKGAGIGGSITGKGCNISIVDDPVKDAEEAYNENRLNVIWRWYTGTFLSRLEDEGAGGIEIVNMTRWAKKDVCGRILDGTEADEWFVFKLEAMDSRGNLLCPELLSRKRYESLKTNMDAAIFRANFHQEPVDIQGRLYKTFKTYTDLPKDRHGQAVFEKIISYTDTADQGSDFLCSVVAGVYRGEAYVLDVLYTKEGMEVTEPAAASMLVKNGVNLAEIESNSGGRGYARNVERLIWEKHKTRSVVVKWFHQSKNKIARILSNSNFVMEHIYFPVNWKDRWPEYYEAMTSYQKEGKNKNDDAPDATTGIAEMVDKKAGVFFPGQS